VIVGGATVSAHAAQESHAIPFALDSGAANLTTSPSKIQSVASAVKVQDVAQPSVVKDVSYVPQSGFKIMQEYTMDSLHSNLNKANDFLLAINLFIHFTFFLNT
jgi:hypothetical protein